MAIRTQRPRRRSSWCTAITKNTNGWLSVAREDRLPGVRARLRTTRRRLHDQPPPGPDNQRLFSLILRKAGANVTLAENGQIACDLVLAAMQQGPPYDVIFMDMQMPELGGLAATRKLLREADYIDPTIALTANTMSDNRASVSTQAAMTTWLLCSDISR